MSGRPPHACSMTTFLLSSSMAALEKSFSTFASCDADAPFFGCLLRCAMLTRTGCLATRWSMVLPNSMSVAPLRVSFCTRPQCSPVAVGARQITCR